MVEKVTTDGKWRDFVDFGRVPDKILKDYFSHLGPNYHEVSDQFFKYRGNWYHTSDFMLAEHGASTCDFEYHGCLSDSIFSGILIRVSEDGEQYMIATYTI